MIAAVAGALGATLIDLTVQVSDDLRRREAGRHSDQVVLALAA
jgi:hypothetical protein